MNSEVGVFPLEEKKKLAGENVEVEAPFGIFVGSRAELKGGMSITWICLVFCKVNLYIVTVTNMN